MSAPLSPSDLAAKAQVDALIRPNFLKDHMDSGALGFSFGITSAHSAEVVHFAKIAGYTAILMNLEHQRTGLETACELSCAALNLGWVRGSHSTPYWLQAHPKPICTYPTLHHGGLRVALLHDPRVQTLCLDATLVLVLVLVLVSVPVLVLVLVPVPLSIRGTSRRHR
jgi:hypothetical protein